MTLVWEHSKQAGNALLLLLAIADFADDNGVAFPSVLRLAKKSRMSERNTHYVIAEIEKVGELEVKRGAGRNGTNLYQIKIEPTLPLFGADPASLAGGAKPAPGAKEVGGGAKTPGDGGATAIAPEPSLTVSKNRHVAGRAKTPSPVSLAFKAYADGIKAKYGGDYPPSAAANGQLSTVVGRVGAANVLPVIAWYLGNKDPFFMRVKHPLEFLVRDCVKFLLELQAAAGGQVQVPTKAAVAFLAADETVMKQAGSYDVGDAEKIARQAIADYGRFVALREPKYVGVRIGTARRLFSISELKNTTQGMKATA